MTDNEPARAEEIASGRDEEPDASVDLARRIAGIADEKLGTEIVAIDLRDYVDYTDYLVVVTARNERMAKSIHDEVYLRMKRDEDRLPRRAEGLDESRWILLDYLGCVLHVFVPETRELYRLDRLWGEAPVLELELEGPPPPDAA